jgi:cytochrome c
MRDQRSARALRRVTTAAVLLALPLLAACWHSDQDAYMGSQLAGGDAAHGRELMSQYGCGSCHTIPGVPGAKATVGPPLAGVAGRSFIAGVLPNTPQNMVDWIYDPPGTDPKTAMPNLGMSRQEARDIAAYVYTLE